MSAAAELTLATRFCYSTINNARDTHPKRQDSTWLDFVMRLATPDVRGAMTLQEYLAALDAAAGDDSKTKAIQTAWKAQKEGEAWIPATFRKGGRRIDSDVQALYASVLDIDSGIERDTIKKTLNGYCYAAHTSYSHSARLAKWRVIIPLATPTPSTRADALFQYFNGLFSGALDPACRNPSHLYYRSACPSDAEALFECFSAEGELFDPDTITAPPAPAARSHVATLPNDLPKVDLGRLPIPPKIRTLIRKGKPEPERSQALAAVVRSLIKVGLDDAQIASVLLDPDNGISEKPLEKGRPWVAADIARLRAKYTTEQTAAAAGEQGEQAGLTGQLRALAHSVSLELEAADSIRRLAADYPEWTLTEIRATFRTLFKERQAQQKEQAARQAAEEQRQRQTKAFAQQDHSPDEVVQLLNQKHAVISVANRVMIMVESVDPALDNRRVFHFTSASDFRLRYANKTVLVPKDDAIATVPWADFWIKHPARREYQGVTFYPGDTPDGYFNLWNGFAVEPQPGAIERLKAHIFEVLCNGDDGKFEYLWLWCAHLVQRPQELPETAIVLRGQQGTGKNTFVDALGAIFGRHYIPLTQGNQLYGRFSAHLADVLLVFANEAVWGGDKTGEGSLKSMITDPVLTIEAKGKDAVQFPNYRRIIAASNEHWAVPRGIDDRRFFCLDVSPQRRGDKDYFQALYQEIQTHGAAALLFELQAVDLSGWHPRGSMPGVSDGEDMKLESMSTPLKFWLDCLARGYNLPPDKDYYGNDLPDTRRWHTEVTKSDLYDAYLNWCDRQRVVHRQNRIHFARELGKACDLSRVKLRDGEGRSFRYQLPLLEEAQRQFQDRIANVSFDV